MSLLLHLQSNVLIILQLGRFFFEFLYLLHVKIKNGSRHLLCSVWFSSSKVCSGSLWRRLQASRQEEECKEKSHLCLLLLLFVWARVKMSVVIGMK